MNGPAHTYGRFQPAPVALVADAVRRAWARIAGPGRGGRRMREAAAGVPGDVENLPARHGIRHGGPPEGASRVFRAPGLNYVPAAGPGSANAGRPQEVRTERAPGSGQHSGLFKPRR